MNPVYTDLAIAEMHEPPETRPMRPDPTYAGDVMPSRDTSRIAELAFEAACVVIRKHGLDPGDVRFSPARQAIWQVVKDSECIEDPETISYRLDVPPVTPTTKLTEVEF